MGKEFEKTQHNTGAIAVSHGSQITSYYITHHTSNQTRARKDINKRTSQEPSEFPDHSLARSNLPNSKITARHASCTPPLSLSCSLALSESTLAMPLLPASLFSSCRKKSSHPRAIQSNETLGNQTTARQKSKRKKGKSSALRCYQDKTSSGNTSRKQKTDTISLNKKMPE